MRLENYSVAAFEDAGVADDEAVAEAGSAAVEYTPPPEAPSTLLSEMAQQPPVVKLTPPPPPAAAMPVDASAADSSVKPLSSAAETPAPTAPSWQGMNLPSAAPLPAGAAASPWPGIDAATFARIEAMGSHDSGGGGFGGFGGFGGGFGGVDGGGGDTETWDYSFEGVDGAPDVNVSVTYQGDTPISSTTTTTLADSGSSVSPIQQEVITAPAPATVPDMAADVPPAVDGATATPALPNPLPAAGGASTDSSAANSAAGAGTANDTPSQNTAPPTGSASGNTVGKNRDGQDIRVVGGYQPRGAVSVVDNAPALLAGDPNIPADATGATPMRDDGGKGNLLYRIDGGSSDGAIRQLLPAGSGPAEQLAVEHLDTVVVTGRRDPNAGTDDAPDLGSPAPAPAATPLAATTLALTASASERLAAVNAWLVSTGRAAVATLADAVAAVTEALEGVEAGAVIAGELAVAAVAVGINLVLVAPTPNQVTPLGDNQRFVTRPGERLGTLQERGADGEWQDVKSGVALYTVGQQRVALTDEEARRAAQPAINVPAPPQPPLEGLVPPPKDDNLNMLPGAPIDGPKAPTIETYPDNQPLSIDDLIITRDIDVQRRFRGKVVGEGFSLDSDFKPEWYDAHHIIPLNEYADLQGLRDKFAEWNIDLNSLENGVALPNRSGQGTGTPHADTQNNREYERALLERFAGVTSRDEALFTLGQIKQELREGRFIEPKEGRP